MNRTYLTTGCFPQSLPPALIKVNRFALHGFSSVTWESKVYWSANILSLELLPSIIAEELDHHVVVIYISLQRSQVGLLLHRDVKCWINFKLVALLILLIFCQIVRKQIWNLSKKTLATEFVNRPCLHSMMKLFYPCIPLCDLGGRWKMNLG